MHHPGYLECVQTSETAFGLAVCIHLESLVGKLECKLFLQIMKGNNQRSLVCGVHWKSQVSLHYIVRVLTDSGVLA